MKRLLLMGACLLLASCRGVPTNEPTEPAPEGTAYPITLEYRLTISNADHEAELLAAATRTVERRLEYFGMKHGEIEVTPDNIMRVGVNSASGAVVLTERLTEPFSIRFMREVGVEEARTTPGGLVVAEEQGFVDTGLTEEHLDWISEETVEIKSRVTLGLTSEGRRLKERIFQEQMGKNIGIFVRNQPVFKITVQQDDLTTADVVIMIPDPVLSPVFVDDLNVSKHVTFIPVAS